MANTEVLGYSAKLYIERRTMTTETVRSPYEPDKTRHSRDELIEVSVTADTDVELSRKLAQLIETTLPQDGKDVISEGDMYRG